MVLLWTLGCMYLLELVFIFAGYMLRSGIESTFLTRAAGDSYAPRKELICGIAPVGWTATTWLNVPHSLSYVISFSTSYHYWCNYYKPVLVVSFWQYELWWTTHDPAGTQKLAVYVWGLLFLELSLWQGLSNSVPLPKKYFLSRLFPVLLRYDWHTALYKFKVYSIIIWLTYTSWNAYHNKFNERSSIVAYR